ncbi:MAG: hypothetical protein U0Q18_01200 [Bryobacteraceae bacterium]
MKREIAVLLFGGVLLLSSCSKKDNTEAQQPAAQAPPPAADQASGPHAIVHLKDGSKVPGSVVASNQTEMVLAGDDGIERKIPLGQIQSVEYGESKAAGRTASREPARERRREERAAQEQPVPSGQPAPGQAAPPLPPPAVTTRTYELPAGTQLSVRTNEGIDSGTASEGQTFDAQVTRDAVDADGNVVIPRGSDARIVIKSASRGGRFRGASDLVLDMQTVSIGGRQYTIDTADITQKGRSGIGANKRTAAFSGGGAALGAIIGAIAGGGKGAAIGAGAGAGAGAITQTVTKGGAIKIPPETVLTFSLDKALHVTAVQ